MAMAKESSLTEETTPLLSNQHGSPSIPADEPTPIFSHEGVNSTDLDVRFKRWLDYISRRTSKKTKTLSALEQKPQFLMSLFEEQDAEETKQSRESVVVKWDGYIDDKDFEK